MIEDINEWDCLVSKCNSIEDYVRIIMSFCQDDVFNYGRNQVIIEYTNSVCHLNPKISKEIYFILELFLFKYKSTDKVHYSDRQCIIL